MIQAIYIPKQAIPTPALNEKGETTLPLPADCATDMPLRIIMNGQPLKINSFQQQQNQLISAEAINLSQQYFELDYYKVQYIDTQSNSENTNQNTTVDLPEILLYSLQASDTTSQNTDDDTVDLLIHMVDDSQYDIAYNGNDLSQDTQLKSAITMSVYSDAWLQGENGWWGDSYHTEYPIADCKLWTLMGKNTTKDNLIKGKRYIEEATQWLIQDNYADEIHVSTEHHANELDYLSFEIIGIKDGKPAATLTLTL